MISAAALPEITVLSTDPLDPALFDAPPGYARVSEIKINPTLPGRIGQR
jgi:hypothetical protein